MISTNNLPHAAADGQQAVSQPRAERVVPKPVPQSQTLDPRKYQMEQLKRRFSPRISTLQNGTTNVQFQLKPSDPDFPFELDYLECELQIPESYPDEKPALRVRNKDIPRGFSVNIERGWDKLVDEKKPGTTLLALTNALDKELEAFLSEKQTDTVKLVSFKDTRHMEYSATPTDTVAEPTPSTEPPPKPHKPYVPEESFTKDQIAQAKSRRAQETRQLDARMGRLTLFHKSADGVVYTLPLEPKRRDDLPSGLRAVQSVQMIIPLLYPLQKLRILLNDVESEDAELLEEAFAARAAQQNQMSLMSHLNYLTQNMHVLAKASKPPAPSKPTVEEPPVDKGKGKAVPGKDAEGDRSHIQHIPRPPEWVIVGESDESDSDDLESWDSEEGGSDGGVVIVPSANEKKPVDSHPQERGTSISFPSIELHGIELLQVSILSINVKCERCRTINEVTGLHPSTEKASSCKKCATPLTTTFRQEMVHQNSTRAGFIDVSGCTVADMLLSIGPGDVTTNVCRECHGKFSFKIPEVKFLAISHGARLPPTTGPKRRQEKLGLHIGDPLPNNGSCAHYKKSFRWFRFSCCSKVHSCDKCHDEAEDHLNEWANRMICGWCSREQNYAVEACGFCGRSVIGKKGRGLLGGRQGHQG
ncbi:CHY zinc finger domain-containing protein [Apiospora aurea]|uniref:CHY zinc finger domain-containing protein n=1 Tax=Apiospora aurea TaxID=335848 RepID=A0ABR1PYN1_9PEZI